MNQSSVLTAERLRELLHYCPDTGVLTWRVSRGRLAKAGSVAGHVKSSGYRNVIVDGRSYKAHRLAWLHVKGEWPSGDLDHRNLLKDDNRFTNLRPATRSQNNANKARVKEHGHKGAFPIRGKYQASISARGKQHYLGLFSTAEEAHRAYCEAARHHFGEFARTT